MHAQACKYTYIPTYHIKYNQKTHKFLKNAQANHFETKITKILFSAFCVVFLLLGRYWVRYLPLSVGYVYPIRLH